MIPFSNQKFWPLFWTQFFGALNDNVLKNSMVVMITYMGLRLQGLDAPSIVALSGGIFILPFFLFSMMAGQIADKYEKSALVRFVKIWELLITLVASIGFYFHLVGVLLGALFMMGMHSTFFGPIKYSAIPELVEPPDLVEANAYVEVGTFLAILVGTIVGGLTILTQYGELATALVINALALAGLVFSWKIVKLPSAAKDLRISFSPLAPVVETLRLLRDKRDLLSAILAISWFWFFGASIFSLLPPYCKDFLHVEGHVFTAFLAMYTVGIGLGSLLCAKLSKHKTQLGFVPLGAIGLFIFLLDLSYVDAPVRAANLTTLSEFIVAPNGIRLLFDFLMMSVAAGVFTLPLYTLLQERSAKEFRSRVIAGNNVFNAIFMVAAALLVMLFHQLQFTLPQTFMYLAIGHALFCAYIFMTVPEYFERLLRWLS